MIWHLLPISSQQWGLASGKCQSDVHLRSIPQPSIKTLSPGDVSSQNIFWWILYGKGVYVSVLIWLCQERILHVLLCFFMAVLSMWPTFNKSFINHATALGIWRISTCKTNVTRQLENITFDWLLLRVWNELVQRKVTTLLDLSLCTID